MAGELLLDTGANRPTRVVAIALTCGWAAARAGSARTRARASRARAVEAERRRLTGHLMESLLRWACSPEQCRFRCGGRQRYRARS